MGKIGEILHYKIEHRLVFQEMRPESIYGIHREHNRELLREASAEIKRVVIEALPKKHKKNEENLWGEPISPIWISGYSQALADIIKALENL